MNDWKCCNLVTTYSGSKSRHMKLMKGTPPTNCLLSFIFQISCLNCKLRMVDMPSCCYRLACRSPICSYPVWSPLAVSWLQLSAATLLWLYHWATLVPSWIKLNCMWSVALGKGPRVSIYLARRCLHLLIFLSGKWHLCSFTNITIKAAMQRVAS